MRMEPESATRDTPTPPTGRERLVLVLGLLLLAAGFFALAWTFAGDAARSTPRLARAFSEDRWAAVKDYANFGTYWIAIANTAILVLAAASTPLWHRRWSAPAATVPSGRARWFFPGLLACVLLGLGLRWTTYTGGFWHDEGLQMKRVSGSYNPDKPDAQGLPEFREASWLDTWFHYRKPTNHTVLGVPARLCLETWRTATGAARPDFAEWVVRLPSLLAGLASIALVGWLGRRVHSPATGLLAAFLLAIHPWHMHWGVDARCYSIGIFSITLAMTGLVGAIDTGRWRWWLVFGFAQFLMLWASLMHLWVAVALFGVAMVLVAINPQDRPRGPQWGRLILANVLAAVLFLQAMGPNLIQFVQASKLRDPAAEEFTKLEFGGLMDFLSHLFLGLPHAVPTWQNDEPVTTWTSLFSGVPVAGTALLAGAILLAVGGMLLVGKSHRTASITLAAVAIAGAVHLVLTKSLDWYYYPRFSTYLLPVVVIGWACAWVTLGRLAARRVRAAGFLVLPVAAGIFLATAAPQLVNLVRHPHEPFPQLRDTMQAKRAAAPGGKILTACYGLGGDIMQEIYEPRCQYIHRAAEIDALIARARQSGQPLYIAYGLQSFNRTTVPDGFRLLDDPKLFSPIVRFVADDPRHTFFLLKLRLENSD